MFNSQHWSFICPSIKTRNPELKLGPIFFFLLKITYYDIYYESCSSSKLSGHVFYNEFFGIPIFTDTVSQISLEYLESFYSKTVKNQCMDKSNSILLEQKTFRYTLLAHPFSKINCIVFMHRGWQGGKYEMEFVLLWMLNTSRRGRRRK